MKLIKSDKRNRLSEKNLEALIFIKQHFKEKFKEITEIKSFGINIIEDELVNKFLNMRSNINASKNINKKGKFINNKGVKMITLRNQILSLKRKKVTWFH